MLAKGDLERADDSYRLAATMFEEMDLAVGRELARGALARVEEKHSRRLV